MWLLDNRVLGRGIGWGLLPTSRDEKASVCLRGGFGGIMEYAIRQSAAIARVGVEVHFLCKDSFPKERLGESLE